MNFVQPSKESVSTQPTHLAFVDEAYHTDGRYRGLGMVSLRYGSYRSVTAELTQILKESGISEFKWNRLKSARERLAALKLIEYTIQKVCLGIFRLDLLTWDIEDSRHKIKNRDEIGNLHRMYHHLCKNVFRDRWEAESTWILNPDENSAIKWNEVEFFLNKTNYVVNPNPDLLKEGYIIDLIQKYQLQKIAVSKSDQEPLIQLVDLFTGLAVYSRLHNSKYRAWEEKNSEQMSFNLSIQPSQEIRLSNSDRERCQVIQQLYQQCKARSLGVGLPSFQGLKTPDPTNPINFWWYTPQHQLDKAPTRQRPS